MFSLVVVFALVRADVPLAYQEAARTVNLMKGRYLGSQVKPGMTSKQVLAILGAPKYGGPGLTISCVQVGSKGLWIYPDYGVRVNWYATEMWWAYPWKDSAGRPNPCLNTPESARVTSVEFDPAPALFDLLRIVPHFNKMPAPATHRVTDPPPWLLHTVR